MLLLEIDFREESIKLTSFLRSGESEGPELKVLMLFCLDSISLSYMEEESELRFEYFFFYI